jgi:hypothetical protein
MYLGETRKPLDDLEMLVHGYCTALYVHGLVEDNPSMKHFSTWLRFKTKWSTSCGWARAIAGQAEPDAELALFFSFVEKFRELRPRTLSTVELSAHHQPTGKARKIGFDGRTARPNRIDAIQYVPEPIHFLRFHYGARVVDQHTLCTTNGSDATTLIHAKEWVRDELSVPLPNWQDL